MERYNRNHILTVIDDFVSNLIKSIIPLFVLFAGKLREKEDNHWSSIISWVVFLAIILFLAVAAFLKWFRNVYYINHHFIVMRSGLFVVKRREIPFNKIQTINISQNIIQRIFNLAEMKIDSGNSSNNASEISIKIRKADAEKIRETILKTKGRNEVTGTAGTEIPGGVSGMQGSMSGDPAEITENFAVKKASEDMSRQFAITGKELLISGLTSNAVLAGFAFIASIYGLLNDYLSSLLNNSLQSLGDYIGGIDFREMALSRIILLVGEAFIVFLVFSLALSILGTFIKYYGFNVKRDKRNITISFGLFEKRNYIIPVAKIKAVYVRQNLPRQLSGLCTIYVESIGYGNEKGEEAILFPIAGANRKTEIFAELLPEYFFEGEMKHVPKRALRRFVFSYSLFPLFLVIVLALIFSYGWLGFILLPFFILTGFLEYRNSAIGVNNGLICLNNGAYTKSTSLVSLRDIQSVADRSNFLQRRKKLFNFIISIQSNLFGKTIQVKNLSTMLKEMLTELVIK